MRPQTQLRRPIHMPLLVNQYEQSSQLAKEFVQKATVQLRYKSLLNQQQKDIIYEDIKQNDLQKLVNKIKRIPKVPRIEEIEQEYQSLFHKSQKSISQINYRPQSCLKQKTKFQPQESCININVYTKRCLTGKRMKNNFQSLSRSNVINDSYFENSMELIDLDNIQ